MVRCLFSLLQVTFVGLQLARIGVAFRVAFSTERAGKQIRWEQSRRLLQGTLVALSPARDKFRTICKLAVIADRPLKGGLDQDPPTVDLFWADPNEAVFDPLESPLIFLPRNNTANCCRVHDGRGARRLLRSFKAHACCFAKIDYREVGDLLSLLVDCC